MRCSGHVNPSAWCFSVLVCGMHLKLLGRFLLSSEGLDSAGGLNAVAKARSCSASYRIREWFGLEGTFRGHLVQPPSNEQGHLQLDQVAQSPIQPGLECFQGWGIDHLSGQPGPGFHHPYAKKFLPYIQFKSALFKFKTITLGLIATYSTKTSVHIFFYKPPLSTGRPQ